MHNKVEEDVHDSNINSSGPDTAHLYGQTYFQGGKSSSFYDDYINESLGPSRILAETLFRVFRPTSAMDVGCAVGHTVKRLREYGVNASGVDISTWAVNQAAVDYVFELDISRSLLPDSYDLVYSYDVVEHIPPSRLQFSIENLWEATKKHLLLVPAVYQEGTTEDPNEPTHMIFHDRNWWLRFCTDHCSCRYNEALTQRLALEEHSRVFDYSDRILVFSK